MESELVSLGVWESKEIIYHYDFIPSSTLFRSMKLCTKRRNQKIRHGKKLFCGKKIKNQNAIEKSTQVGCKTSSERILTTFNNFQGWQVTKMRS